MAFLVPVRQGGRMIITPTSFRNQMVIGGQMELVNALAVTLWRSRDVLVLDSVRRDRRKLVKCGAFLDCLHWTRAVSTRTEFLRHSLLWMMEKRVAERPCQSTSLFSLPSRYPSRFDAPAGCGGLRCRRTDEQHAVNATVL